MVSKTTVEDLTSSDEFDVLSFVMEAKQPEDTVTVYTDNDAGLKLQRILTAEKAREEKAAKPGKKQDTLSIGDDIEYTDEDEVNELHERINNSAVAFELRGLSKSKRRELAQAIQAELGSDEESPEFWELFGIEVMVNTIQRVYHVATGRVDKNAWDRARVQAFDEALSDEESIRLQSAVREVNFTSGLFDSTVTADFS